MPDLLTHFLVAFLIVKILKIKRYYSLFYIGAILPDVSKIYFIDASHIWFYIPLHTPIVIALTCLLIAFFFENEIRKKIFTLLIAGSFLHLFLDLFQKHIDVTFGYKWFFPVSWNSFEIGLFWPESSIYFIPFLLIAIFIYTQITKEHKK